MPLHYRCIHVIADRHWNEDLDPILMSNRLSNSGGRMKSIIGTNCKLAARYIVHCGYTNFLHTRSVMCTHVCAFVPIRPAHVS